LEPRSVQFLTQSRALHAKPGTLHSGPGRHRLYSQRELVVAIILGSLSKFKLPIGTLISLAEKLREILSTGEELGYADPDEVFEMLRSKEQRKKIPKKNRLRLDLWASFELCKLGKANTFIALHVKENREWEFEFFSDDVERSGVRTRLEDIRMDWGAFIVVDVRLLLCELYPR
jgi:hypothetical protein